MSSNYLDLVQYQKLKTLSSRQCLEMTYLQPRRPKNTLCNPVHADHSAILAKAALLYAETVTIHFHFWQKFSASPGTGICPQTLLLIFG